MKNKITCDIIILQIAIDCKERGDFVIYGHISAKETETAYAEPIREAIRYCRETNFSDRGESRQILRGGSMIIQICDRITGAKEEKPPEVHRKYAELQYMAEGSEYMGFYPDRGDNKLLQDCLEEKDTIYYQENPFSDETMLLMTPGTYAVFFPEDVHRPFCQVGEPARVKKIVVKVALDSL